ncbi:MAG: cupin domain-containing protein [Candidatus Eremiobacteraeota bacterium]|nr:cupin domain-containing protein [Candidatus Eremiobacteraeota bacterium]
MKKVNSRDVPEFRWGSPGGKYRAAGRQISEALGREPQSTDALLRHPFDIEIQRIEPGCTPNVYHSHSMQWEFYHVISGTGTVRHDGGVTDIEPGDAFLFKPGEAHQLSNTGTEDLVVYVVADNPVGESSYYPDSDKYVVRSPQRKVIRSENLDYFDGEE